jgi:glyoxylate reductase
MKKILITRKLIKDSEDKASKTFDPIFNSNDELYSQSKVIEMSKVVMVFLLHLQTKWIKKQLINYQIL